VITTEQIAGSLSLGDLGTTFGGGPVACAAICAVIGAIREERLLDRVGRVSELVRSSCIGGVVQSVQGRGLLIGLRTTPPARVVRDALLERDILAGTSGDPNVLRLLPPLILEAEHVARLADALQEISP
jgi:acetylornithine/N-succinyldiaminopimelate aminotransferase